MSKTETRTVKMTPEDIAKAEIERDEAYAHIGAIAVTKAKANAEAAAQTKFQTKIVDRLVANLESGEHDVVCRILLNYEDGKAHFYRQDTNRWVSCRPMTDEERQQPIDYGDSWAAVPETSEAAKKKSPGLKEQEKTEVSHGMAGEPMKPVVVPPPADAPDEVRAAVIEAGVPDSMIDAAVGAIRDGGDPATVIKNAKRAVKGEKPAKEKKPGKKKDVPTPEEQARLDLLRELRDKFGLSIGTDAAFAILDGMDREEAIARGKAIKALYEAEPELAEAEGSNIQDDVFNEGLSVEDAIKSARLHVAKMAEAAQ